MTIPMRQMTLATILERNARLYADRDALVCQSTSLSYSGLNSEVDRLADTFRRKGVAKGTRVAVLMRNCHRFIEILLALSKLGAVLVPLNWRLASSELVYVLLDSDSTVLVYGSDFEEAIRSLQVELDGDITVLDWASVEREAGEGSSGAIHPIVQVYDDDVAVQMYTAAFGGRPRGAQITHGGYVAEAISVSLALSVTETDCALITVPLFHTFGLELAITTIARGGKCVLIDSFDAQVVSHTIERESVSILVCAGQQLTELVKESEQNCTCLSSLRIVMGSGAPKEMREVVRARAPRARFVDAVYGQTECGAMVTGCDTEEGEVIGNRCVGRPLACQDVRVFGENDAELAPGQAGEIVVRGPRVMAGYYKHPKVNQELLQGGWLHTGDSGLLDERGYLHYMGRKRELIKTGMENVYPVEVEAVFITHPAVREVAVIGVPDEQWGEAVTAIVALNKDGEATAEELIQFCKERIASYKKPKYVHFVDELPRDGTGQIARQEIKARYSTISDH